MKITEKDILLAELDENQERVVRSFWGLSRSNRDERWVQSLSSDRFSSLFRIGMQKIRDASRSKGPGN